MTLKHRVIHSNRLTLSLCLSLSPSISFSTSTVQPSRVSPPSTRSRALRRPRAWTASTNECPLAATLCRQTPAWTPLTRRCHLRPTVQKTRAAAAAATSSEAGGARELREFGKPPKCPLTPHPLRRFSLWCRRGWGGVWGVLFSFWTGGCGMRHEKTRKTH